MFSDCSYSLDDKHAKEPSPLSIDESNHKTYFHSEKIGHKLDAIANSEKVSFCVCEKEYHKDGHWLLNIRSVIIFGRIRIVDDWSDDLSIRRDGYSPHFSLSPLKICVGGSKEKPNRLKSSQKYGIMI